MSGGKQDRRPLLTREAAIELHCADRERLGYAASTIAFEARLLRALLPRLRRSLAKVREYDLRTLLAFRNREVSRDTAARELGTLRALFAVLVEEGHVRSNPAAELTLAYDGVRASPPLVLTEEAVQQLLVASLEEPRCRRSAQVRRALALRNRALVELLYGLGIRAAEVHAARVVDLDLTRGAMLVRRAKRGEPAHLPLPAAAVPHLDRYLKDGRPHLAHTGRDQGRLIVTERGTPVVANEVLRVVSTIAVRAGLRAHPHAFRRSVASHLVEQGASLVAVQKLLGHVNLDTTQRYVFVDGAALHEAVSTFERVRSGTPQAKSDPTDGRKATLRGRTGGAGSRGR